MYIYIFFLPVKLPKPACTAISVIQKLEAEQHLLPSGSSGYQLAPPPHQPKSRLGLEQRLISFPLLLLSPLSL